MQTKRTTAVVTACLCLSFNGCRKRDTDEAKAELVEAGFQFTQTDWFRAARQNDRAALVKFINGKFPADTRDAAGNSALHESARAGSELAADYLLKCGLLLDSRGEKGFTPLMTAIASDQTAMVGWLLRQGADQTLKNNDGLSPLMLAVKEGRAGSVVELAAHTRQDLDPALLLAALVGKVKVIDALTNFGASIHTRMSDGRTPLMIAAENNHADCVKLLLDLGASRLSTDEGGHTAADLATNAGFTEIADLLNRPAPLEELALESIAEITTAMEHQVEKASEKPRNPDQQPARSLAGFTLSPLHRPIASAIRTNNKSGIPSLPPLVMRAYREREVPLRLKSVRGETAIFSVSGPVIAEIIVHRGEKIPGSTLTVSKVQQRIEFSKVSPDGRAEISTVEVIDSRSGLSRRWISGVAPTAHDPSALVEEAATGLRFLAMPGQHFKGADGAEYIVSDVRPNQIVIQEKATGMVETIPLRGPRG
jgi:ankyrin repeat protein